jgi:hypothetical protein
MRLTEPPAIATADYRTYMFASLHRKIDNVGLACQQHGPQDLAQDEGP